MQTHSKHANMQTLLPQPLNIKLNNMFVRKLRPKLWTRIQIFSPNVTCQLSTTATATDPLPANSPYAQTNGLPKKNLTTKPDKFQNQKGHETFPNKGVLGFVISAIRSLIDQKSAVRFRVSWKGTNKQMDRLI